MNRESEIRQRYRVRDVEKGKKNGQKQTKVKIKKKWKEKVINELYSESEKSEYKSKVWFRHKQMLDHALVGES